MASCLVLVCTANRNAALGMNIIKFAGKFGNAYSKITRVVCFCVLFLLFLPDDNGVRSASFSSNEFFSCN